MRPWYKKKRFLIPLVLLLLIVVASIASNGDDSDPAPNASSGGATSAAPDAPPAFPGATAGDVVAQGGESVTTDTGVKMTATKLTKRNEQFLGTLLCTTVTYENGSDEPTSFNGGFDWKLQNPAGAILMNTFGGDKSLNSGELAPSGKTTGEVCFKPDNGAAASGQYIVLFDPSFRFSSDRIAWINTL